jgi:mono/diheme cytochrome c family protein
MSEPAAASCTNTRPVARRRSLICGGVLSWVLSWPIVAPAAEPSQSSANAPQGWFTRDQAARGRSQYRTQCASCHADNMAGIGPAPPLAGGAFLAKWSTLTVSDLFERVRTTMPQNAPHSLGDSVYTDITAFILRANNFPTGETELSADSERLRAMPLTGGVP